MNFIQHVRKAQAAFAQTWDTDNDHRTRRNAQRRFDRNNKNAVRVWYALTPQQRKIYRDCDGICVVNGHVRFQGA